MSPNIRAQLIEGAVEELMEVIDAHHYSSSNVAQADTVAVLEGIISACRDRAEIIKLEMNGK